MRLARSWAAYSAPLRARLGLHQSPRPDAWRCPPAGQGPAFRRRARPVPARPASTSPGGPHARRRAAGPHETAPRRPGRRPAGPRTAPGAVPELPAPAGPAADRPPAARQGRPLRPGPGGLPRRPAHLPPVPRHHRAGAGGLAPADPRLEARGPGAPLPAHRPARRLNKAVPPELETIVLKAL